MLIEDERIVAVLPPGTATAGSDTIIDADGLAVLPGLVDAHVHVRDPGLTQKEDFESATRAAAAGGVTTIMVMPFDAPVASTAGRIAEKAQLASGRIAVDVALQGAIGTANLSELDGLAAAGVVTVELLLGVDPATTLTAVDAAGIRTILTAAGLADVVVGVSCEDFSLVEARIAELRAAGRSDAAAILESRRPSGEEAVVAMVAALTLETGASVHIRQVSLPWSLAVIEHYHAMGADLSFEVTPHNLVLTDRDAVAGGARRKVVPPLRPAADVKVLVELARAGRVPIVATDHAPHAPAEKAVEDLWAAPGGLPGLESFLLAALAAFGGNLALVAEACSRAPAVRFGLGASKGRIAPGFDADLVLVEVGGVESAGALARHTRAGYTPFEGVELPGSIVATMLRGTIIADRREVVGPPRGRVLLAERGTADAAPE